jgi:hypothetical protein
MQDATKDRWTRESHWSEDLLSSLSSLNQRFLELAGARAVVWRRPHAGGFAGMLAPMSGAERAAAADCPYALFDVRFQDAAYWDSRLQFGDTWRVADAPPVDEDVLRFTQLALFFSWHVASTSALAARLLLGMAAQTAESFARMTVNGIPGLAVTEAAHLRVRFSECGVYWHALTNAALRQDAKVLKRVQLCGLQLSAAAQLPSV